MKLGGRGGSGGRSHLQVHISGENSDTARRGVHGDAQDGKTAGRGHTRAKVHAHLASLASALELKIR
jgi:hypothetical protein